MAQIDDNELVLLRSARQLLDGLMTDPKTKRDLQKLVKMKHPNVVTDDDLAEPTIAPIKAELEELKKFKQQIEDERIEAKFQASFDDLKDDGWTEDGLEKLKKLMIDRQIPDVYAAAALFEKQNPPPKPLAAAIKTNEWSLGSHDDEKFKRLLQDPDRFARDEAAAVLNEVATEGKPKFGAETYGWGQPR
jgi:hypothetical protein